METTPSPEITPAAEIAPRPKRRRRWLRRLGWAAVWLVTLYALFVVIENWRGRRAWNSYVAEMKAIGEPLDAAAVIPPPVPDAENFAMAPLFLPLFDYEKNPKTNEVRWRDPAAKETLERFYVHGDLKEQRPSTDTWRKGQPIDMTAWQQRYRSMPDFPKPPEPGVPERDVLLALSKFDPLLASLREAASRPKSRFPIRYEDNIQAPTPHIRVLRELARLTQLRASAELSVGEVDRAYEDLQLTFRLADSIENEPSLISQFVRASLVTLPIQPLWEGLARHQWTEPQLAELQQRLAEINSAKGYQLAFLGERHTFFGVLDAFRKQPEILRMTGRSEEEGGISVYDLIRFAPQGWIDQNKASLGRYLQEVIASVDTEPARFSPDQAREIDEKLRRSTRPLGVYNFFACQSAPTVASAQQMFARAQGTVDLALVAAMLERHRLRHQKYPASLAQLDDDLQKTPRGVPPDCVTGNPPHYALQPDSSYTLYYEGWNATDDGGQIGKEKEGSDFIDLSKGDWVWPQPVEP